MEAFKLCGWPAFAAVGMSGLALFIAMVSLALAVAKPRIGGVMSLLALAFALGPGAVGFGGTLWGRSRVDSVLQGDAVAPEWKERIRTQGYEEAGACTSIGLVASAPPLLLAGLALVIALARRKSESEPS